MTRKHVYYINLLVTKVFEGRTSLKRIIDEVEKTGWKVDTILDFGKVEEEKMKLEFSKEDILTARRCLLFKGFRCNNKNCSNKACPLNSYWKVPKKEVEKE